MPYRKHTPWHLWLARVVLLGFIVWIGVYLLRLAHISHEIDIQRAHLGCLKQRAAGDHTRLCEEPTNDR